MANPIFEELAHWKFELAGIKKDLKAEITFSKRAIAEYQRQIKEAERKIEQLKAKR